MNGPRPIKGPGGQPALVQHPSGDPVEIFEPRADGQGLTEAPLPMRRPALLAMAALVLSTVVVAGPGAVLWAVGTGLSAPAQGLVGPPPADLPAQPVTLAGAAGTVQGWFVPGQPGQGAVLLLHGIRSDRRQMLARARFLHAAGHALLLIDLPAHGESGGARIGFGHAEADGVRAAVAHLRQRLPHERWAVIGVSLGAAAFVLSRTVPAPHAAVLESMYPTIEEALANRLRLHAGAWAALATPLLLAQLPLRWGLSSTDLRPLAHMPGLAAPVLVAAGAEDRHTTAAETRRLFDAAAPPKALWLVAGAGHVDLHAFDPAAYEARIGAFLHEHLRRP